MPPHCGSFPSPQECWDAICTHHELFVPTAPKPKKCIINSQGDGKKGIRLRPLNQLSWYYYAALHGYKIHSYEPKKGLAGGHHQRVCGW